MGRGGGVQVVKISSIKMAVCLVFLILKYIERKHFLRDGFKYLVDNDGVLYTMERLDESRIHDYKISRIYKINLKIF